MKFILTEDGDALNVNAIEKISFTHNEKWHRTDVIVFKADSIYTLKTFGWGESPSDVIEPVKSYIAELVDKINGGAK